MALTKAEQEARDKHEAFEKEQAKSGVAVHLPRESDKQAAPVDKKKPGEK